MPHPRPSFPRSSIQKASTILVVFPHNRLWVSPPRSRTPYKWNYTVCILWWPLSFGMILRLIHIVECISIHSFTLPSRIPLYECTTTCLLFSLPIHTWVISSLGLICINLFSTFVRLKYFSYHIHLCVSWLHT